MCRNRNLQFSRILPRRLFFSIIVGLSSSIVGLTSQPTYASSEREFVLSCTYGVLAGTLVGAASLAFVDRPGENLQHVARGASIGLYIGIGLGYYTAFVLPKQLQNEEEKLLEDETKESWIEPKVLFFPVMNENKVDGFATLINVATF